MLAAKGSPQGLILAFPYVEKILEVSDSFIKKCFLDGSAKHVMEPFFQEHLISQVSMPPLFSVGGVLIQAAIELAQTGFCFQIVGQVGEDAAGCFYENSLKRVDIETSFLKSFGDTSQVLSLKLPSKEFVQCLHLSASLDLDPLELQWEVFEVPELLLLDAHSLIWGYFPFKIIEFVKKNQATVCFFLDTLIDLTPYKGQLLSILNDLAQVVVVSEKQLNLLIEEGFFSLNSLMENELETLCVFREDGSCKMIHEHRVIELPSRQQTPISLGINFEWIPYLAGVLRAEKSHKAFFEEVDPSF
ncbi:MAG: hypothetical protein S4CHLAM7_05520 [Chlamydiae bacterium]|nr:hypothetical protein [Chlamydiota bacterium]